MSDLTIAEFARAKRVLPITVRRWIKAGKIRAHRFGKKYLIPREQLTRPSSMQTAQIAVIEFHDTTEFVPLLKQIAPAAETMIILVSAPALPKTKEEVDPFIHRMRELLGEEPRKDLALTEISS